MLSASVRTRLARAARVPTGLGIAVALGLGVAVVVRLAGSYGEFRLPSRLAVREVVTDLSDGFDGTAVVAEPPEAPARVGDVQPDPYNLNPDGTRRQAIVAAPGTRIRFRTHAPPGAALAFSVGVQGDGRRDRQADGVRFSVAVDGQTVLTRVVNPAANRHDRHWFDDQVDLRAPTDRDVEIVLATDAVGPHARLSGTPGWTHVRVVRESERDRQPARTRAPSVLILVIDTLRADQVGCYGATPSPTPALDRLAARGLVFTVAVSQSSWTLPATTTLLTGLPPTSHGVTGASTADSFLADTVTTIASQASTAGITTVGVSGNLLVSRGTNLARGFETFVDLARNPARPNWAPAKEINDTFLRWLSRNRSRRFLAYLHYMDPHQPYTPPPELRPPPPPGLRREVATGQVRDLANDINYGRAAPLSPADVAYLRALYAAEVRAWDSAFETLLTRLAELGVADQTVVVVTADHGEQFQEHGHLSHGTGLWEELVRIPLVVAGPGVPVGRVADVVQGVDIFPTVSRLLGLPLPPALPGQDLLAARAARPVFSETSGGIAPDGSRISLFAVRTDGWKLIHAPTLGRYQLYDLAHDPGERDDRYATAPEGTALVELLARWRETAPPPPRPDGADPALREKLRALGYLD